MRQEKMARSKVVCKCNEFYCYSLSGVDVRDEKDIAAFESVSQSGFGLVRYLKELALADERNSTMRTYLVRDCKTDELVGYFSLKAGLVSLQESLDGSIP